MKTLRDAEVHVWWNVVPLDVLSHYCERPLIHRTSLGKPYVPGEDIEFSVSRSAGVEVVAVSRAPVGVDIERIAPLPDLEALAAYALADAEARHLAGLDAAEQPDFFYRCWTRKEACLKAMGTGLHIEPRTIDTTGDGWRWQEPGAGPGFALALYAPAPVANPLQFTPQIMHFVTSGSLSTGPGVTLPHP